MKNSFPVLSSQMNIRVEPEDKQRIEDAAYRMGVRPSYFVRLAALEKVVRIEGQPKPRAKR